MNRLSPDFTDKNWDKLTALVLELIMTNQSFNFLTAWFSAFYFRSMNNVKDV